MEHSLPSRLVGAALTFKNTYVFGGYVRDVVLRNCPQDLNDIDITFHEEQSMNHFIDIVRSMFPGTAMKIHTSKYGPMSVLCTLRVACKHSGEDVRVDCVLRSSPQNPDFSCNSLKLTCDGDIQLWCPESICQLHTVQQIQAALRDIVAKRFMAFQIHASRGKGYQKQLLKTLDRAGNLLDRGWTMYPAPKGACLYQSVKTIPEPSPMVTEQINDKCNICFGEWGDSRVVLTGCSHLFHAACLAKWIQSNPKELNCPKCRTKQFMF
jgi:hypothetical protein